MLVTKETIINCLEEIRKSEYMALDTETTGLDPYNGDTLFMVSVATHTKEYVFDFRTEINKEVLPYILNGFAGTIFMHNAKFDMAFLINEGLDLSKHKIHDTMVIARVERNNREKLSLDFLAKELGFQKNDVKSYMDEHKLYTMIESITTGKREKRYHFSAIPNEVLVPYAEKDARITYELGLRQLKFAKEYDMNLPINKPRIQNVIDNENALTPILLNMEKIGIKIDLDFTKKARLFEHDLTIRKKQEFKELTGMQFIDSYKTMQLVFDKFSLPYTRTAKGAPCFDDDVLSNIEHPIAKCIREYRSAYKKSRTYYANFLELSDAEGIIHTNFQQAGTVTGRLSCRSPNLQNLNKIEPGDAEYNNEYQVRRCFIPRPGYLFYMLDFSQMEYILLLEYARERELIDQIQLGKDMHQATADLMGVSRREAKTINFMLMYGGGASKLASVLGVPLEKAHELKALYFSKLPNVQALIKELHSVCEKRGYIFNWFGRRYDIPSSESYKATNYLIQGGCADIIKKCMVELYKMLATTKSRMLVQIHDEILFEIHEDDMSIVNKLATTMECVYPSKFLPMRVNIEYSQISWFDKIKVK